jgi:hypothetical protein
MLDSIVCVLVLALSVNVDLNVFCSNNGNCYRYSSVRNCYIKCDDNDWER